MMRAHTGVGRSGARLLLTGFCALIVLESVGTWIGPIFGDEIPIIQNVLHFIQARTIVPVHFNYPTFFSYLLTAWSGLVAAVLWVVRSQHPIDFAFGLTWSINGSFEFGLELFALRLFPVLLTVGLIIATYRLGREAYGRDVGLAAAGMVASSRTLAERSAWLVPDVLVALIVTVVLILCVRYVRHSSLRPHGNYRWSSRLVIASALVGVAAATKYNGVLAAVGVVIAWLVPAAGERFISQARKRVAELASSVTACFVAFVGASAAVLLVPHSYWDLFRWEARHMAEGQLLVDWGQYPYFWIPMRLFEVEGLLGLLLTLSLAAMVVCRKERAVWVVGAPALIGIAIVGSWRYTSLHYLLGAFPALAVLAAVLLWRLPQLRGSTAALPALVLAVCLIPGTARSLTSSLAGLREPANVVAAERWIEASIPAGERVDEDWYSLPTIWNPRIAAAHREQVEVYRHRLRGRVEAVARKPVFAGHLGYRPDPPAADRFLRELPTWVITSSETEPLSGVPLAGYGADHLRELHRKLFAYYDFLRTSGLYAQEREFSAGAGPVIGVYRRTASIRGGGANLSPEPVR